MKKKLMVFLCLLALLMTTAVECGNTTATGTKVTLNKVAHSVFYAPMYVAFENDYFEEEGLDVTLVTGFGADKTMTALLSGKADIRFMGPESTIYTYQGGMEDYAVNFVQLTVNLKTIIIICNWSEELMRGKALYSAVV